MSIITAAEEHRSSPNAISVCNDATGKTRRLCTSYATVSRSTLTCGCTSSSGVAYVGLYPRTSFLLARPHSSPTWSEAWDPRLVRSRLLLYLVTSTYHLIAERMELRHLSAAIQIFLASCLHYIEQGMLSVGTLIFVSLRPLIKLLLVFLLLW